MASKMVTPHGLLIACLTFSIKEAMNLAKQWEVAPGSVLLILATSLLVQLIVLKIMRPCRVTLAVLKATVNR